MSRMGMISIMLAAVCVGCTATRHGSAGQADATRVQLQQLQRQMGQMTTRISIIERRVRQQAEKTDAAIHDIQTLADQLRTLELQGR